MTRSSEILQNEIFDSHEWFRLQPILQRKELPKLCNNIATCRMARVIYIVPHSYRGQSDRKTAIEKVFVSVFTKDFSILQKFLSLNLLQNRNDLSFEPPS